MTDNLDELFDRAIEHLQTAKTGLKLRSLGRMTEELLNARSAIERIIVGSGGDKLLQQVAEVQLVMGAQTASKRTGDGTTDGTIPVTPPPRRFKLRLPPDAKRPFDHALRYGCYFPGTDLGVSDMGGRGTGEPPDVEWID